jgi:plastocyanin
MRIARISLIATTFLAIPITAWTADYTVVIKDMKFTPSGLKIKKGDAVTWKNETTLPHTATSDGSFDSETIQPGKSFTFKFPKPGTVSYHCVIHGSMKGSVKVE